MKKSKTVLFGLIFALTACGGGGSGFPRGRKVSKEEFIAAAEDADKIFTVNYATIEYKTWSYGSSEQSGTQNYFYSGGSWQRSGSASSITDFASLLNYSNLAGVTNQVKSVAEYDELDLYVKPFGVSIVTNAVSAKNKFQYEYQEKGLLSYYYQSSTVDQVGLVYYQTFTATYSLVS